MYRQRYPDDPGMHHNPDSYTRVTYVENPSFIQRIKSSLFAILIGLFLIVVAAGLLFWNEGRAVQTAKSLDEGLRMVHPLQNVEVAFQENNGKLVHLSGPLKTYKVLYDPNYGLAIQAVKLKRKVEMFQWVEIEHKREINEGSMTRVETTYSYSTEWRTELIRSRDFYNSNMHQNPTSMSVTSTEFKSDTVQIGNFFLSSALIGKITNFKKLSVTENPKDSDVQINQGSYYHGRDPSNPQVGDLRVTFEYAGLSGKDSSKMGSPDVVSVIALQLGNQLATYQTEAGDPLEILYMGQLTAAQIFHKQQTDNVMFTWMLRFGGWLVMFVGFGCMTSLFVTLVDWIPVVRNLVNLGITTLNLTLSISLSLTVIALGWIRYRPWLGCTILLCATLPFILSKFSSHRRRQNSNI